MQLLCLLWLFTTLRSDFEFKLNSWQCLDNRKINYFQNSDVEIPDLWQVRLMMCGYESQCAMQMAAYVIMTEILGMNVTFHPTLDYDDIWNELHWNDDDDDEIDLPYPSRYFRWLEEDRMDLLFELWETQIIRRNSDGEIIFNGKTEYIIPGKVDFGGFVGAISEEAIWIPRYLLDNFTDFYVPQSLRDNTHYRQILIDTASDGGLHGTDYVNAFGAPSDSVPIIWCSNPLYFGCEYMNDLITNFPDGTGMNFNLVTTGNESSLALMIADLYQARQPFAAYFQSLDLNFGRFDEASGELQQFEKLVFPRNPDQSLDDPCFVDRTCQFPVSPLQKMANIHLKERFPEAYAFYKAFEVSPSQINLLISKFLKRENDNTTTTEKWLNAACDWLKDEASSSTWNIPQILDISVNRWQCPEECGIDGHGGFCDYYTGECVCDHDELFVESHCKSSCPGLIGPYLNGSGSMTFDFCSGHGFCDIVTQQCLECDEGFVGLDCGTKLEEYLYPALSINVIVISSLVAILGLVCIAWLWSSRQYKTVQALSVTMSSVMTLGLIALVLSNIAAAMVPKTSFSCIAYEWLFGMGGCMAILSPLLKALRVSRLFHNNKMLKSKETKITDTTLLKMMIKACFIEMGICIGYTVTHIYYDGTKTHYNFDSLRMETQCHSSSVVNKFRYGSFAYFCILLVAMTYFASKSRRAIVYFKEATCCYITSFIAIFCMLITIVFRFVSKDPAIELATQSAATVVVTLVSLILFYGPRMYRFWSEPENRNFKDKNLSWNRGSVVMSPNSISVIQVSQQQKSPSVTKVVSVRLTGNESSSDDTSA